MLPNAKSRVRSGILLGLIWNAPALMWGQALAPPPQDSVFVSIPVTPAYGQLDPGTTFTMETWVYLSGPDPQGFSWRILMGKFFSEGTDPYVHYMIGLKSDGRTPLFSQSTGQPQSVRSVVANFQLPYYTWTHLAAVLGSGTMSLYVNGQLAASGASPGPPASSANSFTLGGGRNSGGACSACSFQGALREARVWSRALTSAELMAYSTQRLTGKEPGLLANWSLSEGRGNTAGGIGAQTPALTIGDVGVWSTTLLLQNGPYWEVQELTPLLNTRYELAPAIFRNAQGRPDLLLAYTPYNFVMPAPGPVLFLHNEGDRKFTPIKPQKPVEMVFPSYSAVADFDGDGLEDVVVADSGFDGNPFPGGITRIFMQRVTGMVDETALRLPPGAAVTHDVCSGDVNGDGYPDLFLANLGSSSAAIKTPMLYLNNGTGHFRNANQLLPPALRGASSPSFLSCAFVDVNRDGAPDLMLGTWGPYPFGRDLLLLNDGKGNLRDVSAEAMPMKRGGFDWGTLGFAEADVNRDGWPDIIVSISTDSTKTLMQLLINNHDGTFHDQPDEALNVLRTASTQWYGKPFARELNKDGWPDLFVWDNGRPQVPMRLYQNMGGRFEDRTVSLPIPSSAGLPADFDGDGRMDIALFSFTENSTSIKIAWGKNLWPPVAFTKPVITGAGMAGGFPGIVQNGWVAITGTNLTAENIGLNGMTWGAAREFATGRMPEQLGGVSVTVNGKPAFVYYASPTQINVLSPIDSTLGAVQIVVTTGGLPSAPFNANMLAAAPSFPLYGNGKYLVATHADYTLAGPTSLSSPGYTITPAKPGETIVIFGFGFGLPTTTLVNGSALQSGPLPALPAFQIGGITASVAYAGVISPGLYQFNVEVPAGVPDGDSTVTCVYQGSTDRSGALLRSNAEAPTPVASRGDATAMLFPICLVRVESGRARLSPPAAGFEPRPPWGPDPLAL